MGELERLREERARYERTLRRIIRAHAHAQHLQDIARAALAGKEEGGSHDGFQYVAVADMQEMSAGYERAKADRDRWRALVEDLVEYLNDNTPDNSWGLLDKATDADRRELLRRARAALDDEESGGAT